MSENEELEYLKLVTFSAFELTQMLGVSKPTISRWIDFGYLTPLEGFKTFHFDPHEVILLPIRLKEINPWTKCIEFAQKMFGSVFMYLDFCRRLHIYRSITNCKSWIERLNELCVPTNGLSDVIPRKDLTLKSVHEAADKNLSVCVSSFEQEIVSFATQTNIFGIPSYHPLDALSRIYMTYIPKTRR